MKKLGISLYPDISEDIQKDKEYLDLAAKYGFTRLFVCLLSTKYRPREEVISLFADINSYAKDRGFEIIFDVSPQKFNELNIKYDDLSFFKEIHADGIRLDESFGGTQEAEMTYNRENLKIELNASVNDGLIERVMCFHPNKENLMTCHNYYPLTYTGLGLRSFIASSARMKRHQLKTAAFVTSQNENCFGPWKHNEGLCTLEMHRFLPMELQIRHMKALDAVDDIIIGNAYASEEELKEAQLAFYSPLTFHIETRKNSALENEILFDFKHTVRGDMSEYMARSSMPRIVYRSASIPLHDTDEIVYRGDIIIMNNTVDRYKGEVHLVLQTMKNDGRMNVVGTIPQQELILLDELKAWNKFALKRRR